VRDPRLHSTILSFCDARTLVKLIEVSKFWRRLACSQPLWKYLDEKDFPYLVINVLPNEEKVEKDLEAGNNATTIKSFPWVEAYSNKVKNIRILRKETDQALALYNQYQTCKPLTQFGKSLFINGQAGGVILPLFLFTVLLAVKMDKPEQFSWLVTFIPFYIFDVLIIAPIISYWSFYLACPLFFKPGEENGIHDEHPYKWHFIFQSFHNYVPMRHRYATAFRIVNTLGLCSWVAFTVTFPIGMDRQSEILINASLALMILSGIYGLFICKLIWGAVN
jgi:hypothetical protein